MQDGSCPRYGRLHAFKRNRPEQRLIARYRKAGLYDITHDFYAGGRHEMLNEINREVVRANLLAWIFRVLKKSIGARPLRPVQRRHWRGRTQFAWTSSPRTEDGSR